MQPNANQPDTYQKQHVLTHAVFFREKPDPEFFLYHFPKYMTKIQTNSIRKEFSESSMFAKIKSQKKPLVFLIPNTRGDANDSFSSYQKQSNVTLIYEQGVCHYTKVFHSYTYQK